MLVKLSVGTVYKFVVEPPFEEATGVYEVQGILAYQEVIDAGVVLASIYSRYAVPLEVLDEDLDDIRNLGVYKLTDPDNLQEEPLYLPVKYIVQVPDHNIQKYSNMVLAIHLGTFDNAPELDSIGDNLVEYLTSSLGVDTLPQLFELDKQWLTHSEYNQLVSDRQAKANKVINYFSECVRLREEVDRLRSRLSAYEDKFLELSEQTGP